ncbi:hypothetical protein BpJC7_07820 [Weizmannia acidilactici]|uniref:Uncharacterized protein n=1 Tax=Weizmannia acidilactici TaxID=2607726 RepID=A0A5J4JDT3_9BACI|nr:hypothetical protein BpJC4_08460 [Weizmannia acidilactici]GER69479.1 hypothetical protein BpJC7_07820 [Weizmannia acidilactici]GER73016.1 hypothetical protein BpPP18_10830 [Weizmannia acidilactici]
MFVPKKGHDFTKSYGKIKKNMKNDRMRGFQFEPYCKTRPGSLSSHPEGTEPAKE